MKKILALAVLAGAATAQAAVLASNPEDFGANFGFGFYSDGAPGQYYSQQIAENFSIGAASTITGVNWAGASETFNFGDYTNMVGFHVEVYSDTGGFGPGASIHAEDFTTAATSPTLQGNNGLSNVYGQSATFASSFNLPAGNYWVSIGGILADPFGDAWVWADGLVDDGIAYSFTPNAGGWTTYNDGATSGTFDVVGTAVPAPASLALLGLGGLVAGRRRR